MTEETQQDSTSVIADAGQQDPQSGIADQSQPHPGAAIAEAAPPPPETPSAPLALNSIYIYAAGAAVLGILVGVVVAFIALGPASHNSPYDLGSIVSNADGLTGHLILTWNQKFGYQLVVEPNDPVRRDGFSLAASSAPRPLSIDIQLKDSRGAVLCGKTILLKFDPRRAAAVAASGNGTQAATDANASAYRVTEALDIAQAEAQELTREHDQDVFQNNPGRDGQTDSLSAQGEMPCSRQVFDHATSWNFSPNFLTIDQQAELQNRLAGQSGVSINTSAEPPADETPETPRRKARKKAPVTPPAYAIEGDDELVAFDFTKGMIETSGRRFFAIDKLSVGNNLSAWQDVPANIHYRCDLNSLCIIKRAGAGAIYGRLRR
jgi:hypothetical protein